MSVYTAAVAVLFVVAAVQVAVVTGAGAGPIARAHPFAESSACELLPIGTSNATIATAAVGDEVTDILNSDLPGQRGWLTWTGDVSEPVLAASLVLPGDSHTYVDPDDPGDRAVSVGDWVRAKPGVVNGRAVRRALDRLKNREIVVAVWDAARAQGTNAAYHVSGFARFSVTGHGLPAENRISARYLGPAACLPPPGGLDALDATASTAEDAPVSIELTGRSPGSATLTFILTSPQQGSVAIEGPASCTSVPATSPNHTDDDDDDGGSRPGRRDDDDDDGGGRRQGGPATCSITALYTPDPDANGVDGFTFTVSDDRTTSAPASVTIDISPVNDPPVTAPDSAETRQGTAVDIPAADVLSNDQPGPANEAAQKLTVTAVRTDDASHGTATLVGETITYTPEAGYVGPATVTYTTCDDGTTGGQPDSRCSDGTITITVTVGGNQPPTATEQRVTTAEDTALAITLAGDDPDGDALSFTVTDAPTHGDLSGTAPNLTYTPDPDANGTDSFAFTTSDAHNTSPPATVAITVTEVNDAPAAETDEFAVGVIESVVIPAAVVLWNDVAGPDNEAGQGLEVGAVAATPDSHGVVSLAGDTIVYTPDPAFAGTATVGYTLCDKGTTNGQSDPLCDTNGEVKLVVVPANRPPTADSQELVTAEDVELPITLTGSDPDGDSFTYLIIDPPEHGSLVGSAPDLTYVPAPDYYGPDRFTFTTNDGRNVSETATVDIDVTEVNDPPVLGPDTATVGGADELPPLPPRPSCPDPCGVIYGDPHVHTFDHGHYQFQTVGEFIAAKSTTDDFEVQVRNKAVEGSRVVSLPFAVAMRVGSHRISMYRTLTGANTFIDGVLTDVPAFPRTLAGGGTIGTYGSNNEIFVVWPDGSVAIVAAVGLFDWSYRFTVRVGLAADRLTRVVGILGDADGERPNDLVTREGVQIDFPEYPGEPDFDDLYQLFGHSWRIAQAESLFEYGPGETTETYTDRTFPDRPVRPADLPDAVRANATTQCGLFGVTEPALLDSCIVDVGVTGDVEFATSSAEAQEAAFGIPNNTGVTSLNEETTVTVEAASALAVRAFTATAGQKVTLSVSGNTIPLVDLAVRRPDGTFLTGLTVSEESDFHDTFTLPVDGTYTISVDPRDDHTGSLTFSLDPVPENVGMTSIDLPTTVMIGTVGENAVRSFTAEAGQMVTLSVIGNTIPVVDVAVREPDGSFVAGLTVSEESGFRDTFTLPVTGTYTITVDPRERHTGMLTFSLDSVPVSTGETSIGTPTAVTIGTVGENAVRTFTATAGQLVTLSVTDNTIPIVDLAVRQPNGSFVAGLTVSTATGFRDTFTLPVDGTYTITVDPRERHTGSLTFSLDSVPENTGETAIGTPTTVTIGTVGENAVRTFTGQADQELTLSVTGNTIPIVDLAVRQPNGSFVAGLTVSTATGFRDAFTLPVDGTYTLTVDPREKHIGSLTFTLDDVPAGPCETSIGTSTTVAIAVAGENSVCTFPATAGQLVTLSVSGNTIPGVNLVIREPDSSIVGSLFLTGATGFRDTMELPVAGTYTLTVDPSTTNTGTLTFVLGAVPENTGETSIGTEAAVTIGTPGENAVRTFAANAGQLVTLSVSGNTIPGVNLVIREPDTSIVGSLFLTGATGFRDTMELPVTGTYTLTVDPSTTNTGALTFLLGAVPQNTGETAIGTETPVTIGTPGENAIRSFAATAGQLVTLSVSGNTIPGVNLVIREPDGSIVGSLFLTGATGFLDTMELPVAGTYTITVDPFAENTGALTFRLNAVPANTRSISIGTGDTVTIGTPGENAVRTFAGTAGQIVTLTVSANTMPGVELTVVDPNGDFVDDLFVFGSTGSSDVMTLPVTGTYTLTVDPVGPNIGSLTVLVDEVSDTGEMSFGVATVVTIDTPGENAARSLTATAGQRLALSVSGNTIPDDVEIVVTDPNGDSVGDLFVFGSTGFMDVITLPLDGTYTITVNPLSDGTGALTLTAHSVPENSGATSIGEPTTVTIGTPGENAVRTFTATAGQLVAVSVSGNTIQSGQLVVRDPDGFFVDSLFVSDPTEFSEAMTLPGAGAYTISTDPFTGNTGQLTFTLHEVSVDTGETSIGVATTVSIGTPGHTAARTFTAAADQLVAVSVSGNTIPNAQLTVSDPNGDFVDSLFVSGPTASTDAMTLALGGTYTVTVDPLAAGTGELTFTVHEVPENTGETSIGTATTVTIGTPGETAIRTFTGEAEQLVSLSVSANTIPDAQLIVREPDGSFVDSWFVSDPTAFGDVIELPVAGTYSLTVDPFQGGTGSMTFTLNEVPENTGVTSIGTPTPVTIGTPGENAARTFTATAGQQVTLEVSDNTIPAAVLNVREPGGDFVGELFVFEPTATSEVMTLPADGTYTLTVDPFNEDTGSLTFVLNEAIGGAGLQSLGVAAAGRTFLASSSAATTAVAAGPPVLELSVAELLANDRPGPANEGHQTLTVTDVSTDLDSHGTAVLADDKIIYTADVGYSGPATITYTACDNGTTNGQADPLCSEGTIHVTVQANHPPTAAAQQLTTQEDVPLAITLSGADADGDALGFRITDAPARGALSGVAPAVTYTPAPNFQGTDSFRFATNDTQDESVPALIDITVSEVNDVPSAQPDSITSGVGRTASVAARTLLANDGPGPFDERGQALTLTAVTATPDTHGTVSLADGAVTYVPDAGFTATAKVSYTVCDNGTTNGAADPRCAEGEFSIVPNLAPTAAAQSASTQRNTAVTITLAGSDPENDVLTFAIASEPEHGVLAGTGDTRTYTPDTGFTGSDSFTFTAADAFSRSTPATVSIEVAATPPPPPPPPPIIRPDAAATTMNTPVLIDVLANDTAAAGSIDAATLAVVVPPTNGTAAVEAGKIRYTPAAGVQPDDRFTYEVCATLGGCGRAEVTVSTVVPNRPPVATADEYQVDTGAILDVAAPGFLGNDSDPDPGDVIQARLDTGVSAGMLLLRFDGSFRYTPGPGFAGLDSFTYYVVDRAGLRSDPVRVTIDVVPLGPAAIDDEYTTTKNNPVTVMPRGVLANDRDAHTTDILTASLDRAAFRGTVDLNPDGSFVYIPDPDFVGTDSFLYVVTDVRDVASAPGRVEINVTAPDCALPTVDRVTPADGTEVSAPTAVTANIAPPAGETVEEWKVTARNQDRGTPVVLASGTGAPPLALATFDPTLLINGPYQILVAVKASGGCTRTAVSNVFVTGDMKLGDYQTTYLDMETSIAGFPIQVLRTYDTTDKRRGDFGVGWRVELSGMRATPNNRLGQGGWYTEPFGFPFTRFRLKTTIPHFVTVTSPGGRVEVFDFVPAPTGPLLSLTTPEFHARPGTGTTSTLEDVDFPILALGGDSLATNGLFGGTVYDPTLFRLTTADGVVMIIDRFRGLQSMKDRNGNEISISEDGVHSASTDRHLTFVRDGAGRITEIRGPAGKLTQYVYSGAGDLQRFVAANGGVDTFSYDANHRLLAVDGPGGTRLRTLNYGSDGRLTSLTDATGNTITLSSDVDDRTEIETSPSGRLTTLASYGADGNLSSLEEVFGGHSRITRYEYDAEGRRTRTIAPLGRVEILTYDAAGNVTSRRTPKGEVWSFAFNDLNLPTTTTAPDGTVVESTTYDAKGNLTSATYRDGNVATVTNDSRGLPLTVTDSFGTTTLEYDVDQQLITRTDPAGGVTRTSYDSSGREISIENPAGEITQFARNNLDQLVAVTAANGSAYAWAYDPLGRVVSATDTGGRTESYEYDAASRLVKFVDRASRIATFTYDPDGNIATVSYADGEVQAGTWDPVGRLVSLTDADTIVELGYNDANDLVSERTRGNNGVVLPDVTLSYNTDANGQRVTSSGPGGDFAYAYDSRGRLSSLRDDAGGVFALAYDGATDRLTGLSRPNGVNDALSYRENRLTARNASISGSVRARAEYTLDSLGRRTSLTDLDGGHTFTHDLADRLTSATHPAASGLAAESFAYDTVGNRTSWTGSPPGPGSYDQAMQLLSDGTYDYTYDAEGRLTQRRDRGTGGVTRYTWSDAGLLSSITAPNGATSRYRYDALGRRLEADEDGTVRRFVYSGWNLRNEFDGANALRATYVAGLFPDSVYEIVRDGTRYYPLFDGVGSVTTLTDATGASVGRVRYSAFGIPQFSGVTEAAVSFTGHQFDAATGLVYARARYYDPTLGRFLSQDPEPAINPYSYAFNAPLEFTDPTGRMAAEDAALREKRILEVMRTRKLDRLSAEKYVKLEDILNKGRTLAEKLADDPWIGTRGR